MIAFRTPNDFPPRPREASALSRNLPNHFSARFRRSQQPSCFQSLPHSFTLLSWKSFILNVFPKTYRGYTPLPSSWPFAVAKNFQAPPNHQLAICAPVHRAVTINSQLPRPQLLALARESKLSCLRKPAAMKRILLIEDDRDIVELVRYNLSREGFDVVAVGDGSSGLAQLRKSPPDLLILDLMLPKLPGLEVCKEIRRDQKLNRLPILILSARGEEADRVLGLELGADDYVTKPFSPRELLARVRALLRRLEPSAADGEKAITRGALQLDPASFRVTREGEAVPMSTLEFRLLYFLASHPDRVYSRDQLLDA